MISDRARKRPVWFECRVRLRKRRVNVEAEIECTKCGWQGYANELLCSDKDMGKENPKFNICPDCGSVETCEDIDQDET